MATIRLPRRPAMTADGAPDRGPAKGPLPLPVLLADRQEVAFVATPRGIESLRIPRRYWGAQIGVVAIPVSDEEVRSAELQPSSDAGAWPRVVTRPDLLGVVGAAPPATLADIGLSPAVLELVLENLERRAGILLVSGGPATGRSTTLDLLALTLSSRGRAGGRIGPRVRAARPDLPWLADALSDWPVPESLMAAAPDFVLVEHLEGNSDLLLAARLASSGSLVLAGAPAPDPGALAKSGARGPPGGSAPARPAAAPRRP